MKKIIAILCGFLLTVTMAFAQTHVSGDVSGNWAIGGSPYIVDGEIQIQSSDSLSIEPGVRVEFSGHYKFNIYGRLLAEGTDVDTIVFTAQNTAVGWHSMRFYDTATNGQDSSKVVYCKLEYSKATGATPDYRGGAIYAINSSDILIQNSQIVNNSATTGGGIYLDNSDLIFENVIISNNLASGSGGGIYLRNSNPGLTNVRIIENTSTYDGGGINCYSSSPSLKKVTLAGNISTGNGGGIACYNNSNPSIVNATISQNIAYQDGCGIACLYNSSVNLLNGIVWNNNSHEIFVASTGNLTVSYTDVQDSLAGIVILPDGIVNWLDGNIDNDPVFVDPINNDFHLQATSPCIDAGDPDPVYNDPDDTRGDMGAYNYQQSGIRGVIEIGGGDANVEDVLVTISGDTTGSVYPDENGKYSFVVNAGTYTVRATLEGYFAYPISFPDIVVAEGELVTLPTCVMTPVLPGTIEGKMVLNGLGEETAVTVSAGGVSTNPFPVYDEIWHVLLYYYYILEITPGVYDVTASLVGYQDSTVTGVTVQSNMATTGINFVLQPIVYPGYIEGKVTLKGGSGNVENVEVTDGNAITHPDADGNYHLETVSGIQNITASLDGYTSVTIKNITVLPDQTVIGVNMTLINWSVVPGNQYVMIVYATATLDGKFICGSESNQLAAFGPGGDDDCRGIATWKEGNHPLWCTEYHYWSLPGYWYLTVVSNNQSGEQIHFKCYETETDSIYGCYESINFVEVDPDTCEAFAFDLTVPSPVRDQVFNLIPDWNWISFNLNPYDASIETIFAPLTPDDIREIKGQYQGTVYFPGELNPWVGDLTYITEGEGYLVNMINSYDGFTLNGEAINPITHPIDLNTVWNWIGYYPQDTLLIGNALESIGSKAHSIKTQSKSAIYFEDQGGWVGDLLEMKPGVGYKICMNDSTALTYPGTNCYGEDKHQLGIKKDSNPNIAGWKLMPGTIGNMIAIAKIMNNDKPVVNSNKYTVGVFDNDGNCRSVGKKENGFWYFTVVGNENNEDLHFKIYDSENQTETESNEIITYFNDSAIGNPTEPLTVKFNSSSPDIPKVFSLNQNYPNPFSTTTAISYQLPEAARVEIAIYNILGQKVTTLVNKKKEAGHYSEIWNVRGNNNCSLPNGIYFYKITTDKYSEIKKMLLLR